MKPMMTLIVASLIFACTGSPEEKPKPQSSETFTLPVSINEVMVALVNDASRSNLDGGMASTQ